MGSYRTLGFASFYPLSWSLWVNGSHGSGHFHNNDAGHLLDLFFQDLPAASRFSTSPFFSSRQPGQSSTQRGSILCSPTFDLSQPPTPPTCWLYRWSDWLGSTSTQKVESHTSLSYTASNATNSDLEDDLRL